MNAISFIPLIPLVIAGVIVYVILLPIKREKDAGRVKYGCGAICCGVFLFISTLLNIALVGKVYFVISMLSVVMLFLGIACFLPPPKGKTGIEKHTILGHIIIFIGLFLGIAHGIALINFWWWTEQMLLIYEAIVPWQ